MDLKLDFHFLKVCSSNFSISISFKHDCPNSVDSATDFSTKIRTTTKSFMNYCIFYYYYFFFEGPYDISAGHLVASSASGASSILLLDEMGCPSDPRIFPAMTRDTYNNKSLLSTFTAFKFPDSPRVRFDVVVKFCLGECESVYFVFNADSENCYQIDIETDRSKSNSIETKKNVSAALGKSILTQRYENYQFVSFLTFH